MRSLVGITRREQIKTDISNKPDVGSLSGIDRFADPTGNTTYNE
jgi:hypothetical protein